MAKSDFAKRNHFFLFPKIYYNNIFEEIISLENLFLAWQEFKQSKTSKIDVQEFKKLKLFLHSDKISIRKHQQRKLLIKLGNYNNF